MYRVAEELLNVARLLMAIRKPKERPVTLFEQSFFDLRAKVKAIKIKAENDAAGNLQSAVMKFLKDEGFEAETDGLKLGRYRGSGFPTAFKVRVKVKDNGKAEKLSLVLQDKFSPKWHVKTFENGVAELNIR